MKVADLYSLTDKVAVVTGARRGIGAAIALTYAEAGAHVAMCDIEMADGELDAVAQKINELGRKSLALKADVSVNTDVQYVVRKTIEEFGRIDILVNNAGSGKGTRLLETTEEDWDHTLAVNLKGTVLFCREVGKHMVERQSGCIINIAAIGGLKAIRDYVRPYAAAKAAVIMLSREFAREVGPFNVRVNAIAPGGIRTELTRSIWGDPERLKQATAGTFMGRMAEPEEVASVALFIAGEGAAWITGQVIRVDGGALA
ncbi:MAG: SDR family oxidoreductase [Dehalococcoidia bacterium]|nr:SDR family oxidoreductase [Dehalococcoidia bacterium]